MKSFLVASLLSTFSQQSFAFVASITKNNNVHQKNTLLTPSSRMDSCTILSSSSEAQSYLDQATQLRAEIAALEGKTLQQVQDEAREKKERKMTAERPRPRSSSSKERVIGIVPCPNSKNAMISQAARAIERAHRDGIQRQTIRLALIQKQDNDDDDDDDFLMGADTNQWPGGAREMYRKAAKPLTMNLMRDIQWTIPQEEKQEKQYDSFFDRQKPNVTDTDIWDFDGSAIFTSRFENANNNEKQEQKQIKALVFPNTDSKYIDDIESISTEMKKKDGLFLLVNPFWRNVDSWGINILAPRAKQRAQKVIFDDKNGFPETYVLLRFSVRGEDCVALKAYPNDWQLFAFLETSYRGQKPIRLGTTKDEPTNAIITQLLNDHPDFKVMKPLRQLRR